MKWEFFPTIFYTTKYFYRRKNNNWAKDHLIPIIEKDLENKNNINSNWDCNVLTNFHLEKNIMNTYKHFYSDVIWDFLNEINSNKNSVPKYEISKIWYNMYENETYQEKHDHFPHHFSMIHYLKFNSKKHPGTKFFNPYQSSLLLHQSQISSRMNQEFLEFNDIEEGDIIFFPSYVPHLVKPNMSDEKRITISLNIDLK